MYSPTDFNDIQWHIHGQDFIISLCKRNTKLDNWNLCCCVVDINNTWYTLSSDFAKYIPLSFVTPYIILKIAEIIINWEIKVCNWWNSDLVPIYYT
jgi:hypothetical protein